MITRPGQHPPSGSPAPLTPPDTVGGPRQGVAALALGALRTAVPAAADRAMDLLPAPARATLVGSARTQTRRWRRGGRDGVTWSVRLAVAAAAAYLVALAVFPGSAPLVAALTAVLVVQLTPVSLLANGALRIVAVVLGVAVAAGFAATVSLSWWSLGLAVVVSALLGQVLRLGDNVIEVPISAMLVLTAGQFGYGSAASHRIAESLLGAAVGVALTMVVPPRIVSSEAGTAVAGITDALSDLLERSSRELVGGGDVLCDARGWIEDARTITRSIPRAAGAVEVARGSRRLNLRALAVADTGPGLRQGLVAVENTAVTLRTTYRSLVDAADARTWAHAPLGSDVKESTALVMEEVSAAVAAFGNLVDAQSRGAARRRGPVLGLRPQAVAVALVGLTSPPVPAAPREREALRSALAGLEDARVRLTELVLVDHPDFAELNITMLGCVRRLLVELDLDHRDRTMAARPGRPAPRSVERRAQGRVPGEAAPPSEPTDGGGPLATGADVPVMAAGLATSARAEPRRTSSQRRRARAHAAPPSSTSPTGPRRSAPGDKPS